MEKGMLHLFLQPLGKRRATRGQQSSRTWQRLKKYLPREREFVSTDVPCLKLEMWRGDRAAQMQTLGNSAIPSLKHHAGSAGQGIGIEPCSGTFSVCRRSFIGGVVLTNGKGREMGNMSSIPASATVSICSIPHLLQGNKGLQRTLLKTFKFSCKNNCKNA